MARPKNQFPIPALRKRGKSWQLRWRDGDVRYDTAIGIIPESEAKALKTLAAAALMGRTDWPDELAQLPAVRRYIHSRQSAPNSAPQSDSDLIELYVASLQKSAQAKSMWSINARSYIVRWLAFVGSVEAATPGLTLQFLESLTKRKAVKGKGKRGVREDSTTPVTGATRNRARAALSGFFGWMRTCGHLPKSVDLLDGVAAVRELNPPDQINVWDAPQIPALLRAADTLSDGVAIWVGTLAGLRCGEIARLEWVHIGEAYIGIYKSKTGLARQVPLSAALAERLAREPRIGPRVVPWPENHHGWTAAAKRMKNIHLPRAFPPPPDTDYPPLQYGWNILRHTFASRHVQTGVPLDVVAAWIGDSVATCRKHYARFVPRDYRDTRIDRADPDMSQATGFTPEPLPPPQPEDHVNARPFHLVAPDGSRHTGKNLAHFVRENLAILGGNESRAAVGLSSLAPWRNSPKKRRSWHGWRWANGYDDATASNRQATTPPAEVSAVKRPRGRPRKNPLAVDNDEAG